MREGPSDQGSQPRRIIVMGASSGGNEALSAVVAGLPKDLPAAILVVRHLAPEASAGFLVRQLRQHCALPCSEAKDGEPLMPAHVYLAPSDRHLLVDEKKIWVIRGARENRWRPAIDPLFRSAAVAHRNRAVGVVLSGYLDDGSAGLSAIKRCGGICVVQDPDDAIFPDMPRNALNNVAVDYTLPATEIGPLMGELTFTDPGVAPRIPADIAVEARIAKRMLSKMESVEEIGQKSPLTCPDCGGVLWQVGSESFPRYRCHTGHSYTTYGLLSGQSLELEESLWRAVRLFEERQNLLKNTAKTVGESLSKSLLERAAQDRVHIERLRNLLEALATPPPAVSEMPA